jgi:hypothetical protein
LYTKDCRRSLTDSQYKGHINTTRSGHTCRNWIDAPNYHTEELNYCRTPPGDPDNAGGPWCYISGGEKTWHRCNIPICGGK